MTNRKSAIYLPFVFVLALFSNAFAEDVTDPRKIIEVKDFAQLGQELNEKQLPLVLMFSAEHCGYCVRVEQEFLIPMQISGDYTDRAIIRKLKIDYGNGVIDFDGNKIAAKELASRYNVWVTPTVVFLDSAGKQLAAKQVGLMTPDFYGGYLDESIDTALDMLRRRSPLRVTLKENN